MTWFRTGKGDDNDPRGASPEGEPESEADVGVSAGGSQGRMAQESEASQGTGGRSAGEATRAGDSRVSGCAEDHPAVTRSDAQIRAEAYLSFVAMASDYASASSSSVGHGTIRLRG
jgi:hypothetical protein